MEPSASDTAEVDAAEALPVSRTTEDPPPDPEQNNRAEEAQSSGGAEKNAN